MAAGTYTRARKCVPCAPCCTFDYGIAVNVHLAVLDMCLALKKGADKDQASLSHIGLEFLTS